jgi:ATP-dependent DNA ligase
MIGSSSSTTSSVAVRSCLNVSGKIGAEGIVSKRLGSLYRGRESRDWLKTKCHQFGDFVITGFEELGEGRLEAVYVTAEIAGALKPAGQIRFGFAGKDLWGDLDALRSGPANKGIIPVTRTLRAQVQFFGRYKRGAIRDGVIFSFQTDAAPARRSARQQRIKQYGHAILTR